MGPADSGKIRRSAESHFWHPLKADINADSAQINTIFRVSWKSWFFCERPLFFSLSFSDTHIFVSFSWNIPETNETERVSWPYTHKSAVAVTLLLSRYQGYHWGCPPPGRTAEIKGDSLVELLTKIKGDSLKGAAVISPDTSKLICWNVQTKILWTNLYFVAIVKGGFLKHFQLIIIPVIRNKIAINIDNQIKSGYLPPTVDHWKAMVKSDPETLMF